MSSDDRETTEHTASGFDPKQERYGFRVHVWGPTREKALAQLKAYLPTGYSIALSPLYQPDEAAATETSESIAQAYLQTALMRVQLDGAVDQRRIISVELAIHSQSGGLPVPISRVLAAAKDIEAFLESGQAPPTSNGGSEQ